MAAGELRTTDACQLCVVGGGAAAGVLAPVLPEFVPHLDMEGNL